MAETCLEIPLGPVKSRSRVTFFTLEPSKSAQEASMTAPRGFQEAKRRQEAPGRPPGSNFVPFALHFGSLWDPFETLWGSEKCGLPTKLQAGMLSARWPASGAQPPVRSGHRADLSAASKRPQEAPRSAPRDSKRPQKRFGSHFRTILESCLSNLTSPTASKTSQTGL